MYVKVCRQDDLANYGGKVISLVFSAEDLLGRLAQSAVRLSQYFEPSRGNTVWSVWALRNGKRPNVGGNEFFYLTEEGARRYRIPKSSCTRFCRLPGT